MKTPRILAGFAAARLFAALAVAAAFAAALDACRAKSADRAGAPEAAFDPPVGKRAFSLSVDKSQADFLAPGDSAQIVDLLALTRPDGADETSSVVLSPRVEVLRVRRDWSKDSSLVQLALTPEEAQVAALAVDREDRIFLNKVPGASRLEPALAPEVPTMAAGTAGVAALVYPDQQEFLRPGLHVDVVAVREKRRGKGSSEPVALTMIQDAVVLGVRAAEDDEQWSAVELMATPREAGELMRAAAAQEDLILCVRAPGDRATRAVEPARESRHFEPAPRRS